MSYVQERLAQIAKQLPKVNRPGKPGPKEKPKVEVFKQKQRKKQKPPKIENLRFEGAHKFTKTLLDGTKVTYIYAWRGGPRLKGETAEELKKSFNSVVRTRIRKARNRKPKSRPTTFEASCRVLASNIRSRAIKVGVPFYLPWQDIYEMGEKQNWRCAVCGLLFDPAFNADQYAYNPMGISVDRIDSNLGYEPRNVRLVLIAVNYALNEWGDDLYLKIARSAVELADNKASVKNNPQKSVPVEKALGQW